MHDGVASASEVADRRGLIARHLRGGASQEVRLRVREPAARLVGAAQPDGQGVRGGQRPRARRPARLLFLLLALFPAVLVGLAFASFFPLEHFVDRIVAHTRRRRPGRHHQDRARPGTQDLGGQQRRTSDLRRPRRALEQLGGDHGADRRAQPRLRHRGGAPLVEGEAPVAGADPRAGGLHPDRVRAGPRRARRLPSTSPG